MIKRFWRIRCMSGLSQISEILIPSGYITVQMLDSLLQTLSAKHGLSDDEIVSCFYSKKCKQHSALLEVRYDNANNTRECGHDLLYTASLIDESRAIVRVKL